jgi:hypothetical protein
LSRNKTDTFGYCRSTPANRMDIVASGDPVHIYRERFEEIRGCLSLPNKKVWHITGAGGGWDNPTSIELYLCTSVRNVDVGA